MCSNIRLNLQNQLNFIKIFLRYRTYKPPDSVFVLRFPTAFTTAFMCFAHRAAAFLVLVHFSHTELLSATMSQVAWCAVGEASKQSSLHPPSLEDTPEVAEFSH